jgi:hypothetical protein
MTDDWQKTLEVVVKVLIGIVLGLVALWLLGVVFTFVGNILLGLAGLFAAVLRFLVPVAILAGLVFFVARAVQGGSRPVTPQGTNAPADDVQPTTVLPRSPNAATGKATVTIEADRTPDV